MLINFPLLHFIYSFLSKIQLWQAFVGVKARRVDNYYHKLLASETNEDSDHESNLEHVVIPEKWRAQIEKVIHSSLHMESHYIDYHSLN